MPGQMDGRHRNMVHQAPLAADLATGLELRLIGSRQPNQPQDSYPPPGQFGQSSPDTQYGPPPSGQNSQGPQRGFGSSPRGGNFNQPQGNGYTPSSQYGTPGQDQGNRNVPSSQYGAPGQGSGPNSRQSGNQSPFSDDRGGSGGRAQLQGGNGSDRGQLQSSYGPPNRDQGLNGASQGNGGFRPGASGFGQTPESSYGPPPSGELQSPRGFGSGKQSTNGRPGSRTPDNSYGPPNAGSSQGGFNERQSSGGRGGPPSSSYGAPGFGGGSDNRGSGGRGSGFDEESDFLSLLERNQIANSTLQFRQMTLFAPTNQAFQKYNGEMDDSLVLYHISNLAITLTNLDYSISSELDGNPPLWVTRRRDLMHDDIYVNNARVDISRSYQASNRNGKRQVLHVIDQVLQPLQPHVSGSTSSPVYNPNAYQFLEHSDVFNIGQHRLRSFRQKVNQLKKKEVFNADGRHTFFIPVDDGFKPTTRSDLIDEKVIDGHVIPHHVLFAQATPDTKEFETLAFSDNVKVIISFSTVMNLREEITYVKSNTVAGDTKHSKGVVMADIVRANIPVKNGVVHLIQRPLMVVDTSVVDFLKEKEDGPLCKFYEVILDLGVNNQFLMELSTAKDLTLFAPSNEAWKEFSVQNIMRNHQKLKEILNLHLVRERLPMDAILHNNMNQIYQAPTALARKSLYFNVVTHGHNQTLTVEGGGVNATVTQPNIAATNGFVHIIDRVLGVPYTTVFEKLKTDPMLNVTYNLGKRQMFNHPLNELEHRYTYFVPRDHAWQKFQIRHPSAFKALFREDYGYFTKQILERHVIRAGRAYTVSDLKLLANETHPIVLPTSRDPLKLRVKESDKNYYVEWNGHWIHVFRPDVECTNGIIHVIDEPFVLESDIRATGAAARLRTRALSLLLVSFTVVRILEN